MKQILNQAEGTQEAADGAAEDQAAEHQDTQNIGEGRSAGRGNGVLQRTQGTGRNGTGAGIAVEPGHAEGG